MDNRTSSAEIAFAATYYIKEKNYWLNKLSGEIVKSNFPCKARAKDTLEPFTRQVAFSLNGDVFSALMKLSKGSEPKLHMILTAGLAVLLAKYTGNRDILLGTPIFNPGTEGEFINTILPLRIRLEGDITFKELLIQTRQTIIEASRNANYPVEKLLYQLNLPSSGKGFPLFDIALLFENIQHRKYIRHIPVSMLFSFLKTAGAVEGRIEYDAADYRDSLVRQVADHFRRLLDNGLAGVDLSWPDIEILSRGEKEYILFEFNNHRAAYPLDKTLHRLFAEQTGKTPHHIALQFKDSHLTYEELNRKANRLGQRLREKGIGADSLVAVMAEYSSEVPAGVLGILKAGAAYVPVDLEYPGERIHYILKDSHVDLILTHRSNRTGFEFPAPYACLDDGTLYTGDADEPGGTDRSAHPAYVLYTSGSTGRPKGVIVEHAQVVNYLKWAEKVYVKGQRYSFPLYSSLAFDLTVTSFYLPLITGNKMVIYRQEENRDIIAAIIRENRVQAVKLTPTHLKIIKNVDIPTSCIKTLIVGGEELPAALAREVYKKFNEPIEIYNEYGPTETVVGCMIYKFEPATDSGESVPIGVPIDNARIYLLDRYKKPVPPGTPGEIYISGRGVANGYANKQEITAEAFGPDPFEPGNRMYRSGDLGRFLADGNMEFCGRIDSQLKIRGYRVELGEIENRLMGCRLVEDVVVVAGEDVTGDNYLVAYVVLPVYEEQAAGQDISDLRGYLSKQLPDYMIPTYFVPLEKIPLTPNAKIDRKALPQVSLSVKEKYVAPGSRLEEKLVGMWSEVLGIKKDIIGVDANFFQLGGHSLKASILIARMQKALKVDMPLAQLFKTPTIKGLAGYISSVNEYEYILIEPVEEREYYPLAPAQRRIYIQQNIDPASTGYNIPKFLLLEGEADKIRFEGAFLDLIKRHESFRTTFEMVNDKPVQRIHREARFRIDYYNPGNGDVEKITRDFIRPFDLSRAPLLKVGLVELGTADYLLMVDMHHIISDGISVGILINDFTALYNQRKLPPLGLRYKDYSQWLARRFASAGIRKQEAYWLKQFEKEIEPFSLPTDYERSHVQGFEGRNIAFTIPRQDSRALKQLALEEGITVYMVLLSIYNIMLAKLSGQEDIVVGTVIAGRRHPELQQVMGMFVNTLPLRNCPSHEKSFREFLQEVSQRALDAFENQDYPFDRLVENVAIDRDASRNPLFDILFRFENIERPEVEFPGLTMKPYEYEDKTAKFDINLVCTEEHEDLSFRVEYRTALYTDRTIRRFIRYFKDIISSVLEDPGKKLSDIDVMWEEEEQIILGRFMDNMENE